MTHAHIRFPISLPRQVEDAGGDLPVLASILRERFITPILAQEERFRGYVREKVAPEALDTAMAPFDVRKARLDQMAETFQVTNGEAPGDLLVAFSLPLDGMDLETLDGDGRPAALYDFVFNRIVQQAEVSAARGNLDLLITQSKRGADANARRMSLNDEFCGALKPVYGAVVDDADGQAVLTAPTLSIEIDEPNPEPGR